MNANTTHARPRELSDEEWCDLCMLVVEMDTTRTQLGATLLAEERPSLDELWFAMMHYRRSSENMFDYLAATLRGKVQSSKQAA